jgi:putative acetyltransferase
MLSMWASPRWAHLICGLMPFLLRATPRLDLTGWTLRSEVNHHSDRAFERHTRPDPERYEYRNVLASDPLSGHSACVSHTVNVRTMRRDEFGTIRDLSIAAFGDDPHIGQLLDALRESWAWDDDLSFVAEDGGEVVGHVLYTHAILDTSLRLQDVLVLSPIGVRPARQRHGIGGHLITASLTVLRKRTEPLVFLEGHPDYYPRFGFVRAGDLGFVAPSVRIPAAAFMVHMLPRYEPWMTGALVYPDAFWRADAVGLRD